MKKAWLLDEDVFLYGYIEKDIFYPCSKKCGFDCQKIAKRDIGNIIFYSMDEAIGKYGKLPVIEEADE